jgi:hypothetical protein
MPEICSQNLSSKLNIYINQELNNPTLFDSPPEDRILIGECNI